MCKEIRGLYGKGDLTKSEIVRKTGHRPDLTPPSLSGGLIHRKSKMAHFVPNRCDIPTPTSRLRVDDGQPGSDPPWCLQNRIFSNLPKRRVGVGKLTMTPFLGKFVVLRGKNCWRDSFLSYSSLVWRRLRGRLTVDCRRGCCVRYNVKSRKHASLRPKLVVIRVHNIVQ
jgi:hypothetical protein